MHEVDTVEAFHTLPLPNDTVDPYLPCPYRYLAGDQLGLSFMALERGIHPDADTGLSIGQTQRSGYPLYFEPRFNTLLFAATFQLIVELSTWVQKLLSLKVLIWIFPHIMTVYLIHGFIF